MAKITLTDLTSLANDTSATASINANFQAIEDELNTKVAYRVNPVGEPNSLSNDIDFNSNDLLNCNSGTFTTLTVNGVTVDQQAANAATSAAAALVSENNAATSETNAAASAAKADTIPELVGGKWTAQRFEGNAPDDSGTPDAVFRTNRTHAVNNSAHSFRDQTDFQPTTGGWSLACFDADADGTGTANQDHLIGFQSRVTHSSTGTMAILYGFGEFGTANGGTVSNWYPFHSAPTVSTGKTVNTIRSFHHSPVVNGTTPNTIALRVNSVTGSGSVTNEYGMYVTDLTKGSGTNYPIYIEPQTSGQNYFGVETQVDELLKVGGSAQLSVGASAGNQYPSVAYNYDQRDDQYIATSDAGGFFWGANNFEFKHALSGTAGTTPTFTTMLNVHVANDANRGAVFPGADGTQDLGLSTARWDKTYSSEFRPGTGTPIWTSGAGTPEGAVTAVVGSMYTDTGGGAGTTLYVKESGAGNTGWVAK